MSKNPVQKLVHLKVLVDGDQEGKDACTEVGDDLDSQRPRTRRDCLPGGMNEMRPCPWYGCKYHLGLNINEDTGSMSVRNLDDMVHTCDLDVAEIGGDPGSGRGTGITLEEAGEIMELTRERMRQIEFRGLITLKPVLTKAGMAPEDWERRARAARIQWAKERHKARQPKVKAEEPAGIQQDQEIPLADDGDED